MRLLTETSYTPVLDHLVDRLQTLLDRHAGAELVFRAELLGHLRLVDREVVDFEDGKQELAIHPR